MLYTGWAAIVPIYNLVVLFKITWGKGKYVLLMLISIANFVVAIITYWKLAKAFGKESGFAIGLIYHKKQPQDFICNPAAVFLYVKSLFFIFKIWYYIYVCL